MFKMSRSTHEKSPRAFPQHSNKRNEIWLWMIAVCVHKVTEEDLHVSDAKINFKEIPRQKREEHTPTISTTKE